MNTLLLLLLALLPGFLLLYFILYTDRSERESLGQVIKIMLLGALSVVPSALVENLLSGLPLFKGGIVIEAFEMAFLKVAWVEELFKLLVVLLFAWNNAHFEDENDGIVYVGASALGFAMLENVSYVLRMGITTGILRSITAMPLHCFTGVIMGYYLGLAKFAGDKRQQYMLIFKGFLWAFILHGIYDALLFTQTPAAVLIFPLLVGLLLIGLRVLKKGRALSMERAGTVAESGPTPAAVVPGNQLWKIIISRSLLALSGMGWVVVSLGILGKSSLFRGKELDVVMGTILITFLPILTAILLEISYSRKRRLFQHDSSVKIYPADGKEQPIPGHIYEGLGQTGETLTPPGQFWRAVVARSILTICALFWAIVVLVMLAVPSAMAHKKSGLLMGAWLVGFLPVYAGVLLEDSYRKRRKLFQELSLRYPGREIPPLALASPPLQMIKVFFSRLLLGFSVLLWSIVIFSLLMDHSTFGDIVDVITTVITLSLLPVVLGLMLERSYQRKKKSRRRKVDLKMGEKEEISPTAWR